MKSRTLTLLLLLAVPVAGMAQGKLDQVREAVDHAPPVVPSAPSTSDKSSSDSDTSQPFDSSDTPVSQPSGLPFMRTGPGDSLDKILPFIVAAPLAIPNAIFDQGFNVDSRFSSYPYALSDTAYVLLDRPQHTTNWFERTDGQHYSVRASVEGGSDFDGLSRLGLRLFLDTDMRIGLKSDWDYFYERLPCGCHDQMWIGDFTPTLRFAQNEWLMMHAGAGLRLMIDRVSDRGGVNFFYGFDAFPIKPLHLFGSFEGGTLGHTDLWRLHGGVGVNWTHAELFAGYDFLRIGGVNLQGPMVGLRLWF